MLLMRWAGRPQRGPGQKEGITTRPWGTGARSCGAWNSWAETDWGPQGALQPLTAAMIPRAPTPQSLYMPPTHPSCHWSSTAQSSLCTCSLSKPSPPPPSSLPPPPSHPVYTAYWHHIPRLLPLFSSGINSSDFVSLHPLNSVQIRKPLCLPTRGRRRLQGQLPVTLVCPYSHSPPFVATASENMVLKLDLGSLDTPLNCLLPVSVGSH